jgi:Zn-dependent protease with chaperone function
MNNVKTFLLMGALMALFLAAGQAIGGSQGLVTAFVMGSLMNFGMFFFSDKLVLRMYGAKLVTEAEAPELYRMVDRLRQRAGLPMPKAGRGAARTAQRVRHRPEPATRRRGRDHRNPQVHATGRA